MSAKTACALCKSAVEVLAAVLFCAGVISAAGELSFPSPARADVAGDHAEAFDRIPPEFTLPYAPENYAACFECHHELELLGEDSRDTEFRNGSFNLHRRHTIAPKKGRSCRACHTTDAESRQDSLMRDDVPFGTGGWKLPVKFTGTVTGGSCVVGCHRAQAYDREDPVPLP